METLRITKENSEIATRCLTFEEEELISTVKEHIDEYLRTHNLNSDTSGDLLTFLEKIRTDDSVLLMYVRGRKHDPDYAWETIRHYAENKYQRYPEMFPGSVMPESVRQLLTMHAIGRLKNRDKLGRRIIFLDMTKWDANVYPLDDLMKAALYGLDRFWTDREVQENGVILIENAKGFGTAHLKQHTWSNLVKMRNIFLHSFPVSLKAIFYLNMPFIFKWVHKMSKSLVPKKIRDRRFLYGHGEVPRELLDVAPPEILPDWMGGTLPIEEATVPVSFYDS